MPGDHDREPQATDAVMVPRWALRNWSQKVRLSVERGSNPRYVRQSLESIADQMDSLERFDNAPPEA